MCVASVLHKADRDKKGVGNAGGKGYVGNRYFVLPVAIGARRQVTGRASRPNGPIHMMISAIEM